MDNKFTAIAAFDDMTAFGAIRGLSNRGLKVPGDCSVIGFDDVPMAELSTPGLTTIRQPMERMGKYAAEVVGNQISHGSLRTRRRAVEASRTRAGDAAITRRSEWCTVDASK